VEGGAGWSVNLLGQVGGGRGGRREGVLGRLVCGVGGGGWQLISAGGCYIQWHVAGE